MVTISLDHLHVNLGRCPVIQDISAKLHGGQIIGIIGPNGAGKSTLLRAILGLISHASGQIHLDGEPIHHLSRQQLAKRISYLPQGQTVHWPLHVEQLVALGRLPHLAPFSRKSAEDTLAIEHAMQRADVLDLRARAANELSGGERARVLLARTLAVEASVLIADEPLASLDPGHQIDVMEILKSEARSGRLVLVVLHDLGFAARFCDRLLLLHNGRMAADGPPDKVLTPDLLEHCYGIRAWHGNVQDLPALIPLERSRPS